MPSFAICYESSGPTAILACRRIYDCARDLWVNFAAGYLDLFSVVMSMSELSTALPPAPLPSTVPPSISKHIHVKGTDIEVYYMYCILCKFRTCTRAYIQIIVIEFKHTRALVLPSGAGNSQKWRQDQRQSVGSSRRPCTTSETHSGWGDKYTFNVIYYHTCRYCYVTIHVQV